MRKCIRNFYGIRLVCAVCNRLVNPKRRKTCCKRAYKDALKDNRC